MRNSFLKASALTLVVTLSPGVFATAFGGERGGHGGPDIINNGGRGGSGGAGGSGGPGGAGGTGGAGGAANSGGNDINVRSTFVGMGSPGYLAPAHRCMRGKGWGIFGFGGPGGGGLNFLNQDPSGVDIGPYSTREFRKHSLSDRKQIIDDNNLWSSERATLNCLATEDEQAEDAQKAQERMHQASLDSLERRERIKAKVEVMKAQMEEAGRQAKPGRDHACNLAPAFENGKLIKETLRIRGQGHEDCDGFTKRLLNEVILNPNLTKEFDEPAPVIQADTPAPHNH